MSELEALESRHSVRKYTDRPLDRETVARLRHMIDEINAEGQLHMQLVTDEPGAFSSWLAYGAFTNVSNYVMVIGRKSPSLDYRAGYYTERLVLAVQQMGLNTCIVGLTYKKIAGTFTLGDGGTVVCCIAVGYGADDGRRHKVKTVGQVSNAGVDTPRWFTAGVEAALKAPTAINQQKFFFEYIAPAAAGQKAGVRASRKVSLAGYTKVDLGIAMYNFEVGAGRDNFTWIDSPLQSN